jgi:DNA-binding response OmpR family regulator
MRVVVVGSPELAAALRPELGQVTAAGLTILDTPATPALHVLHADARSATALAHRMVAWGQRHGLVAIVDDGDAAEREALLAAGFDDVVTPPYTPREVVVRLRAVHRRVQRSTVRAGRRRRFGAFTLDLDSHALWTEGIVIALSPIELAVMRALVEAAGRPLSRIELLDTAWDDSELDTSERAVDNVILRLRRKLPRPEALETVRGVGFRLSDRVER